ncbi:MAG: DNA-3-methyladenine glycosylase [Planctomycetes bacterium]|nr:DNA-3-methyladenine glycosylase [Planctomycetota bacterium]
MARPRTSEPARLVGHGGILRPADLARPAPVLAPLLIGCGIEAHGVRGTIVETEAYQGEEDLACHASRGVTPRTTTLYREPGTIYIYLCYGMHHLLNIVCDRAGTPSAVLIRAIDITAGEPLARRRRAQPRCHRELLANGPAKAAQALALDRTHNATVLGHAACPLRLTPATVRPALAHGPRIGVAYAGPIWSQKPWRWWRAGC